MAKQQPIEITAGTTEIKITPTSKSAGYVYSDSLDDATKVNINSTAEGTKYNSGASYAYIDSDNLVILKKFTQNGIPKKTVSTTLINYFANEKAGDVYIDKSKFFEKNSPKPSADNNIYEKILSGKAYENTEGFSAIIGNNKGNTYNLTYNGGDKIYEEKGNDRYNIHHASGSSKIRDYSGKDTYDINGGSTSTATNYVYDYLGSDKYTIGNTQGNIYDYAGNERYELINSANMQIIDYAGKDKYTLVNVTNTADINGYIIADEKGNDKYSFANVKGSATKEFMVFDKEGKDTYTIRGINGSDVIKHLTITDGKNDTASGNDTYKLTDASYTDITDLGGNNKFNLKNSSYINITTMGDSYSKDITDKDSYNIAGIAPNKKKHIEASYATDVVIKDNGSTSADTYNFSYYTEGEDITVRDRGGSDKYTIKNSEIITIRDYQTEGKDFDYKNTFNITNTSDFRITVSGKNSDDVGSYKATNDTYNIVSSAGTISDYSDTSNDSYKLGKLTPVGNKKDYVKINDYGGDDDKLTINAKAKDLVFMSNFGDDGKDDFNSLVIYDTKNKGFVKMNNFYATTTEDNKTYCDFGAGRIEAIKAGKTNLKTYIPNYDDLNAVRETVATFLSEKSEYSSVIDVLQKGNENDIQTLVNSFKGEFKNT